eukprot:4101851-Pleurochrysis_carterae.AAC.1
MHPIPSPCPELFTLISCRIQSEQPCAVSVLTNPALALATAQVETVENEQPSEGAGACVRLLNRRTHEQGCLTRLVYSVLGLGDSNLLLDRQTTTAADCNQAAQRLDKRLAELGGTAFHARGEADDRTGNTEIQPWLAQLWEKLAQ